MNPTLDTARAQRDVGMQLAADHADAVQPKWSDVAYAFLCQYARNNRSFISEDVSDASKAWGMVQPPTDRAWGMVYRKALKAGVILQDGTGTSRRRHASLCIRWQSLVRVGFP